MKMAGFVCSSALQTLGMEVFICQNVHDSRSSKNQHQNHLTFGVDKQMIYLSRETQGFQEDIKLFMFMLFPYTRIFLQKSSEF